MSNIDLGLPLNENASRYIRIKPAELFKATGKALIKVLAGAYTDAAAELPELVAAIGINTSPQERVAILVARSLERALILLLAEFADGSDVERDVSAISIIGISEETQFQISADFFSNPNAADLIEALKSDVSKWLLALELEPHNIKNIINRLPGVIVRCLHNEWRSNASFYRELYEAVDSPFSDAAKMEQDWTRYRAHLSTAGADRVFDETFGLSQIYIEPRCYFFERNKKRAHASKSFSSTGGSDEPTRVLRWATDEVLQWLGRQDKDFSVRTLAGGPGSGKSCFAKMLASRLAEQSRRVLFVPLHQIDLDDGIARSVGDYFRDSGFFAHDPLGHDDGHPLILILDGLDEIQMQGRAAQELAQDFVGDVIRYVDRRNANRCNILCLITGRDLSVQSAEGSLKMEGQIIYLAPYWISSNEGPSYLDKEGIISLDQRDDWWRRYGELIGKEFEQMPEALKAGELDEVTTQPLLNYLVALAYLRGITLDEGININAIYEDLLKAVFERSWAKQSHPSVKGLTYENFVRLLEEVALAVWHGAGRTTTLAEVESHCVQSKVGPLLQSFQSASTHGVSSLLLAFYFRQKGRRESGEKTFEFTHKTFAEYLTSLRIVRLVDQISTQILIFQNDSDQGIDENEALQRWLNVCGQAAIDGYLVEFVRRQVMLAGAENASKYQKVLISLLEAALRANWPVERMQRLSFSEQLQYSRNAEESLIACVNACARVSGEVSSVKWLSSTSAGDMIRRIQGQRRGPANRPVMSCLSFFDFSRQCFDMADLYGADLENSSFVNGHLNYACLCEAKLSNSDLRDAQMLGANLEGAHLDGARFSRASLGAVFVQDEDDLEALRLAKPHSNRSRKRRGELVKKLMALGAVVENSADPRTRW